jgi:hypothetical protein
MLISEQIYVASFVSFVLTNNVKRMADKCTVAEYDSFHTSESFNNSSSHQYKLSKRLEVESLMRCIKVQSLAQVSNA